MQIDTPITISISKDTLVTKHPNYREFSLAKKENFNRIAIIVNYWSIFKKLFLHSPIYIDKIFVDTLLLARQR